MSMLFAKLRRAGGLAARVGTASAALLLSTGGVEGGGAAAAQPSPPSRCEIAPANLPGDTRIVRATLIKAGEPVPAVRNAARAKRDFCRLEGVIEREIGFEIWLPAGADWNGRFLGAGVGGQAGSIATDELLRAVNRGYAAASTDTGHKASDTGWLLGRRDRAENYAGRSNHLLAVKSKAIVTAHYGRPPRNAFFLGCSGGGRQAMTELQRYPQDYDGIIAGAPGVNTPEMSARRLWEMIQHDRYRGVLDADRWRFIADSARRQCDRRDGLADGIVQDPRKCGFRPRQLACKAGKEGPDCLTPLQVAVAEKIYAPLRDENGRKIDDGLLPGTPVSPVAVPEPFTPGPRYLAAVLFGDGVHSDPAWDMRRFNISRDLPAVDKLMNLHADDPAIEPFVRRGGKLIVYHGWADPLVSPLPTIDYFDALADRFGGTKRVRAFARLFMVPGMDHCRGGDVPDRFGAAGGDAPLVDPDHDMLTALERWVDEGRAPERIVASQVEEGNVVRSRPLCAFPAVAKYRGGPVEAAESWVCRPSSGS